MGDRIDRQNDLILLNSIAEDSMGLFRLCLYSVGVLTTVVSYAPSLDGVGPISVNNSSLFPLLVSYFFLAAASYLAVTAYSWAREDSAKIGDPSTPRRPQTRFDEYGDIVARLDRAVLGLLLGVASAVWFVGFHMTGVNAGAEPITASLIILVLVVGPAVARLWLGKANGEGPGDD